MINWRSIFKRLLIDVTIIRSLFSFYGKLVATALVDFLPIFLSIAVVGSSVLHNYWASDFTQGSYFVLNPERSIYFETHVYFIGDRLSMVLFASLCVLLCLPRWSVMVEMYRHAFLVLLVCFGVVMIDYLCTGNKDFMHVEGFDINTCMLVVYCVYCLTFFIKRLNEILNYAENS